MSNALDLQHVTKRFGSKVAVDNVSLQIPEGSIWGFLGQNGAGKTTTIRMIMGILRPDSGSLAVLGRPAGPHLAPEVGYLPEERGLYASMSVRRFLVYFGRLKGVDAKEANTRALSLLDQVGLRDHAEARCDSLSKGMAQKVQLVAALIHSPRLVVLDEPFSGLDPVGVELMRDLILRMKRDGRTVIFSTHVMEQAEQICDSLCMVHGGRLVLNGTLQQVKSKGDRVIHLDYDGEGIFLQRLAGVARVSDAGKHAEISLADDADPQNVLSQLVGHVAIRRFDLREPSLHEIFLRTSGALSHE